MTPKKSLYVIDGNSYAYRAYYALPKLTNTKGFPTNAIYGFTTMLKKLLNDKKPDYIAIAFDHKTPTFRHEKFANYKITRKPTPDTLIKQLPVLKEIISGYNIKIFEVPGFEADDVLGFLAKGAEKEDLEVFIVSSDKDILQLLNSDIHAYNPQKDITLDEEKVEEIYGIKAALFPDYLALTGDKADNIPGVPGIGEKTARELISQGGGIENILSNIDTLPEKIKNTINEYQQQLIFARELTRINTDIDINVEFKDLKVKEPDYKKIIALFEELGFSSLIKETIKNIVSDIDIVFSETKTSAQIKEIIKGVKKNKKLIFYVDNEILSIKSGKETFIIKDKLLHENTSFISAIFKSSEIEKISLDIKESSKRLDRLGIEIKSPVFDTGIIAYLLNPSWEEYSFYKIAINYLEPGLKLASLLSQTELGEKSEYRKQALYCDILDSAYDILAEKIKESNLNKLYYEIEEPLIFILRNMEKTGIAVDKHYLKGLLNEYKIKIGRLSNDIYETSGKTFNINSTKQLREILFEQLNLKPPKKGKTGPSTDEESLKKLAKMHPLPDLILKYRELSKIKGTYLEGLLKVIDSKDKKIHTTFNQTITQTGRLSSSNPNLQTIPIRSELGRQIRKAFIPANKNNLLLSADYSQIELRILAHLSGDENLINAFKEGKDIHRHTAATIFEINENEVSKEMRNIAKTVNFGIIYGISAYGLSKQLEMSINEANDFIENYFILYPGVKKYIARTIIQAREKKYVSTLLNRIRYLPEINSDDTSVREFGERLAVNTPIQGTSADLIKKAMVEIDKSITEESVNATLLLQIHDELLFEVEAKKNDLIKKIITDKMISILTLDIPLEINIKTGSNWLELQKED